MRIRLLSVAAWLFTLLCPSHGEISALCFIINNVYIYTYHVSNVIHFLENGDCIYLNPPDT